MKALRCYLPNICSMGILSNSKLKVNLASQAGEDIWGQHTQILPFLSEPPGSKMTLNRNFSGLDQAQPFRGQNVLFTSPSVSPIKPRLSCITGSREDLTGNYAVDLKKKIITYEFYLFISSVQREKKGHNLSSQWDIHLIRCHKTE